MLNSERVMTVENPMRKIVIVGGGITGMSAAFYTKKWFDERQIPVELTLIEKKSDVWW